MPANILVFAGSLRRDSFNKKLAAVAARAIDQAGGKATLIDLRDYPLPIYDGDVEIESGPPDNAFKLQELIAAQHGLVVVSPEYNHSMPALVKNTLDWVSRTPRARGANPFAGKVAAMMSASPGGLGGIQSLDHLQRVLNVLGCLVLPSSVALPHADEAFDAIGQLKDEGVSRRVSRLAEQLVATAGKLHG
jgi:NAD(P)H-dependent FMN reductase